MVFKPYKVASNSEWQQTWYQKNTEKHVEYNRQRALKSEYQESHKKSQKQYQSKKDVKFSPLPPSVKLCQNIISDFCADTSPNMFEEAGCVVCGTKCPLWLLLMVFGLEKFQMN